MKRRKPINPALLDDMIEECSVLDWCSARPDELQAPVLAALETMREGSEQIENYVALVSRESAVLKHNLRMTELRDIVRFHTKGSACFKCGRLFVPDGPHRGCRDCYLEYLASLPPRPHHDDYDGHHPDDCDCWDCRTKYDTEDDEL